MDHDLESIIPDLGNTSFFSDKVISSFGINFGFWDFSLNFGYMFLIWTTIFDKSVLKLILYGPRIRINQSYPGNIGN